MDSDPALPQREPRRGKRKPGQMEPANAAPPTLPRTPTDRLDAMTIDRIKALESDRDLLRASVDRLQARVDELTPENARLHEALANAESNGTLATILIAGGGGIVSYATFTGQVAPSLANLGAGCLLSGMAIMLFQ